MFFRIPTTLFCRYGKENKNRNRQPILAVALRIFGPSIALVPITKVDDFNFFFLTASSERSYTYIPCGPSMMDYPETCRKPPRPVSGGFQQVSG